MHIPLMNFLYSNGCDLAVPVEGDSETLKINATAPQCVEAAQLVDRMLDNGSLARVAPFDPEFIELAKTGKLLMIPGPTWFGEFIIKRRYEFAEGVTGVGMTPEMGLTGRASGMELGWWCLGSLERHRTSRSRD